jgi:hypothetical protein
MCTSEALAGPLAYLGILLLTTVGTKWQGKEKSQRRVWLPLKQTAIRCIPDLERLAPSRTAYSVYKDLLISTTVALMGLLSLSSSTTQCVSRRTQSWRSVQFDCCS